MTGLLDFLGYGNMPNGGASGLLSGGPFDEMDALRQGAASAPPGAAPTPNARPATGPFDEMDALRQSAANAPPGAAPTPNAPGAPATAAPPSGPMQGEAVPFLNQGQQAQAGNPTGGNPTAPTDVSSSNRQPAPLPPANTPGGRAAQLPGMSQGGLLDRIQSFLDSHRNQISNFGAGMAGSGGGWAQALGAGTRASVAGRQQDETENSTYQALVGKGMDPQQAMAAVRNPMILKQILPEKFGGPQVHVATGISGEPIPFGTLPSGQIFKPQEVAAPGSQQPGAKSSYQGRSMTMGQDGKWYYD